jgi:hypothetical protein
MNFELTTVAGTCVDLAKRERPAQAHAGGLFDARRKFRQRGFIRGRSSFGQRTVD